MSFIGHFPAKLDSKNRVFLPSAYRHQLQLYAAESASSKTRTKSGTASIPEGTAAIPEGTAAIPGGAATVTDGAQTATGGFQAHSVMNESRSVKENQTVKEGLNSVMEDFQSPIGKSQTLMETIQPAVQELTLVIRKDYFENCLVIYPMEQWQAEVAKVRSKLNRFDSTQQMVYRKLVSEAMEITLDANGRMLIPRALLEKAGIGQEVLFVGMEQTIELWAAEKAQATGAGGEAFMSENEFADQIMAFMKE